MGEVKESTRLCFDVPEARLEAVQPFGFVLPAKEKTAGERKKERHRQGHHAEKNRRERAIFATHVAFCITAA